MNERHLWSIKRGDEVTGPFPEKLICELILIGRIGEDDLLSQESMAWQPVQGHQQLLKALESLLQSNQVLSNDPAWKTERREALLRWIDERKQPDRRNSESQALTDSWQSRRTGKERREGGETEQQIAYRQMFSDIQAWLKQHKTRTRKMVALIFILILMIGSFVHFYQPKKPLSISLGLGTDCALEAAPHVGWHGCNKTAYILMGADLRNADLSGVNFTGAKLTYANLQGANVTDTQFMGADLSGAIWVDGKRCETGSLGSCVSEQTP